MKRREALNLALRMDKEGRDFDRVYAWDQQAFGDGWFISERVGSDVVTIRSKADAKREATE